MKRTSVFRLLPVVLMLALAAPIHGQSFGFPWWKDAQFQKELTLTADQSARIDGVFQSAMSTLRPKKEELDRQEAELSRLIAANADEAVVSFQVDKVEAIRTSMNKQRMLMLLHTGMHVSYFIDLVPALTVLSVGLAMTVSPLTAAVLASRGKLSIELVIVLAAAGAIVGDNIGYLIGRKGGRWALERPGRFYRQRSRVVRICLRRKNARSLPASRARMRSR